MKNFSNLVFLGFVFLLCSCAPEPKIIVLHKGEILVQRGQTIHDIAKEHGVLLRDLLEVNNLQPPYILEENQKIRLPKKNSSHGLWSENPGCYNSVSGRQECLDTLEQRSLTGNTKGYQQPQDYQQPSPRPVLVMTPSKGIPYDHSAPSIPSREIPQGEREFQGEPALYQDPDAPQETLRDPQKESPSLEGDMNNDLSESKEVEKKSPSTQQEDDTKNHEIKSSKKPVKINKKAFLRRPVTQYIRENLSDIGPSLHYTVSKNTSVLSPSEGEVIFAGDEIDGRNGQQVVIKHPNGFSVSVYGLKNLAVKDKQRIRPGECLGQVQKDTVFMEVVDKNCIAVNPKEYFAQKVPVPKKKKLPPA